MKLTVTAADSEARPLVKRGQAHLSHGLSILATWLRDDLPQFLLEAGERVERFASHPYRPRTAVGRQLAGGKQYSRRALADLEIANLLGQFASRQELLAGAFTAPQVAKVLGSTRQTPHDRRSRGELLALKEDGVWLFPAWQFDAEGPDRVLPGLPRVLRALAVSDPAKIRWLAKPHPDLDGAAPKDALREGMVEEVVSLAEAVGKS